MMEKAELNLTRKWRSKNFQEIVGQSLVVRILQNSLYLKQFFPVYLFAGQRGCGKTSTARVFASAINCEKLEDFQKKPRSVKVPCLSCQSCIAMKEGKHPDFIEIDAASYTGVDNVRNIIDASSFLPLLGRKKVYLIDEAHMLSKAAFNAFLKILEEPPPSVLFILATTDMHKILETVKSRCFQIFFDPVKDEQILKHLQNLCESESIAATKEGLSIIAKEAHGSVRDAINLLEQVRFAVKKIDGPSVLNVLGHIDETNLLTLFEKILDKDVSQLLLFCKQLEKHTLAVEHIWQRLIELVYDAILIHYKVAPRQFNNLSEELSQKIKKSDFNFLLELFDTLSSQESIMLKTTKKMLFFEIMLVQFLVEGNGLADKKKNKLKFHNIGQSSDPQDKWLHFLEKVKDTKDVVLVSMFQEAKFVSFDDNVGKITVSFLKKFFVFQDSLEEHRKIWMSALRKIFGEDVELNFDFNLVPSVEAQNKIVVKNKANVESKPPVRQFQQQTRGKMIDISDKEKWKLAHELVKHFDGTISEISGDIYE